MDVKTQAKVDIKVPMTPVNLKYKHKQFTHKTPKD